MAMTIIHINILMQLPRLTSKTTITIKKIMELTDALTMPIDVFLSIPSGRAVQRT